jgi:hypothetical protein
VKSIIALAYSLRLTVIAEGVKPGSRWSSYVPMARRNSGPLLQSSALRQGFTKLLESGRTLDIDSIPDEGLQAADPA